MVVIYSKTKWTGVEYSFLSRFFMAVQVGDPADLALESEGEIMAGGKEGFV